MNRRDFMRLMGIASGSSFLGSCGLERTPEKLIPYLVPPDDGVIPGEPVFFKTACMECPAACGISAKVREGWPVKLEGLKDHPVNNGALCIRGQASLSRLYHPERLQNPLLKDSRGNLQPISWDKAFEIITGTLSAGDRKHVYLSGKTSGALSGLIDDFCAGLNIERLPEFELFSHGALKKANQVLFGKNDVPGYEIEKSDFLLTIGADILETFVSPVSYTRQIAKRRLEGGFEWIHLEPHLSLTGLHADKRMTMLPQSETHLLAYLIGSTAASNSSGGRLKTLPRSISHATSQETAEATGLPADRLLKLTERLTHARSPLLISGGISTSCKNGLDTAMLGGLLQWSSGQIDKTVNFSKSEGYEKVGTLNDLEKLSDRFAAGKIGLAMIAAADPLQASAPGAKLRKVFGKASLSVGIAELMNETVKQCDLVLPLSHSLESWGDASPRRDTKTVIQPALKPLYNSLPQGDILLRLLARSGHENGSESYQDYVFKSWKNEYQPRQIESLMDRGFIELREEPGNTRLDMEQARIFADGFELAPVHRRPTLVAAPSIRSFDGRSADLQLLSEIPDPLTTISYGRWISIPPEEAASKHIDDNDEVLVSNGVWNAALPAKIQPLLPAGVFMIPADDPKASFFGVDKESGEGIRYLSDIEIEKTGRKLHNPILSASTSQHGRGLIPDPQAHEKEPMHETYSFYPKPRYENYHWTICVDLDSCTGCSACVAACYIENNVPIVGKKEHLRGRELSWLRIEPYYEDRGKAHFLPMMCQQCDNAPCESVCPVYATYHNPEGLNAQVYNRCVGTRYCSNNCPYKVRRFNWFDPEWENPLDKMLNPDIAVRDKGIMEKCTFCIQRIRAAKDHAKDEERKVKDGEMIPACAQTCPADAIVFGNLLDTNSKVYKLVKSSGAYRVFEHLGTEPSVYYISKRKAHKNG